MTDRKKPGPAIEDSGGALLSKQASKQLSKKTTAAEQAASDAIEQTVVDQAITWYSIYASGEMSAQQRQAIERWRTADPDHESAWQRLENLGQGMQRNAAITTSDTARKVLRDIDKQRLSRRQTLKALALLTVLGGAGSLAVRSPSLRAQLAEYRSERGQRLRVQLADGTRLLLNTATAVNSHFDEQRREIQLVSGEILIETAPDPAQRPLLVSAADGWVQPIGTRFTVRRYPKDIETRVQVHSGQVLVNAKHTEHNQQRVAAGEQIRFNKVQHGRVKPLDVAAASWVNGVLSAQDMALGEFLDTLALHRPGWLSYDPVVAALRISGSFPLDDTDRVLVAITRSLPVEIHRRTRYWVRVIPSDPATP